MFTQFFNLKNDRFKIILLLVVIFLLIVLPRVPNLGYYATVDEPYYFMNSANFYYALYQQDYAQTDLIIHPGVLNLWAGAASFWLFFPEYGEVGEIGLSDLGLRQDLVVQGLNPVEVLAYSRLISVLMQGVILTTCFYYAKKLFGSWVALVGVMLVSFDPLYFASSRLHQPDGILSVAMLLAFLAYLWFIRDRQTKDLIVAGVAAGLSWLTKPTGALLIPIIGVVVLLDWWRKRSNKIQMNKSLGEIVRDLAVWGLIGFLVYLILWPAMWVNPIELLMKNISTVLGMTSEVNSPMFFNGNIVPEGEFGFGEYYYYYPLTYLWRATPVVLMGLVLGFFVFIKKGGSFWKDQKGFDLFAFGVFVIGFTMILSLSEKKADRYLLPIYLPLDILAALGWAGFLSWIFEYFPKKISISVKKWVGIGLGLVVLFQAWSVYSVSPYYHGYYNPLMGGGEKAEDVMMIGIGEGLDEAARYINSQPDAQNLKVYAWYAATFDFYFSEKSSHMPTSVPLSESWFSQIIESDYVVVYVSQRQRGSTKQLFSYLETETPEYSVWINGIEYVQVYNMREIREGK